MAYNNLASLDFTNTPARLIADGAAVGTGVSVVAGYITGIGAAVGAVLSVIWIGYQIFDLWDRRRKRAQVKKKPRR